MLDMVDRNDKLIYKEDQKDCGVGLDSLGFKVYRGDF
jgi:hypothetical protein